MAFFDNFFKNLFGKKSDRDIATIKPIVDNILLEYESLQTLTHDELRQRVSDLKQYIRDSFHDEELEISELKTNLEADLIPIEEREFTYASIDKLEKQVEEKIKAVLDEILPQAFAIMKDTARRFYENDTIEVTANAFDRDLAAKSTKDESVTIKGNVAIYKNEWMAGGNLIKWDMVHYNEQLIGGIVLHQGKIAEMATGEGKTLVATLPVFLNALTGRGVHLVTVNDYLAKRDSEWMGTLFQFHGLSVDCIDKHQPNSDKRRLAYAADITYGTNNEFGFDYLRDNMAISPEDLVQRPHNYAIVDEVDSVLIDEARTPLIISGPVPRGDKQLFEELKPKVVHLYNEQRKLVTQILTDAKKLITAGNTERGGFKLLQAYKGLPKHNAIIKFLSEEGMRTLLLKTENIYLAENSKRMPEVTNELFFVIEEKNNSVELTEKGIDLISVDAKDPKFFILPDIGSNMADIERSNLTTEQKQEQKNTLASDYAIKSERVHTINQLVKAYTLFEKDIEYVVLDNKVKIVDEQTGRIMEGRRYSDGLHQAIEAKENVKVEAATQTFATITLQNYFRMYKKLAGMTGTAETEAGELWDIYKLDVVVIPTNRPVIRNDYEDLVYRTKREKFNAVINEIVTLVKEGRPVLVGTTSVETSELLSRMLNMRGITHNVLNAKQHQREAHIVAEAGKAGNVTIATNMAGRGTDIKLTPEVKKSGGLAIIGTERHESRRVDRQLRGRAGRQGDPGSSQFFVSLEDNLMRIFGSDRVARIMDRLGIEEGEVIQHRMITKSIERAQRKVEQNHFGVRKRLLEYDDVMNSQREVIYTKRRHALYGERIGVDILNMMYDTCQTLLDEMHGEVPFDEFSLEVIRTLSTDAPFSKAVYLKEDTNKLVEMLYTKVIDAYKQKAESITHQALPVIKDVYEKHAHTYEQILVPITDGLKIYNIRVNLRKAYETNGKEVLKAFEKTLILITIDEIWKEHLREMDDLRQSVQNASYEQKDPLLIYKLESYNLFKDMLDKINRDILSVLMKIKIYVESSNQVKKAEPPRKLDTSRLKESKNDYDQTQQAQQQARQEGGPAKTQKVETFVREEKKIGNNELCPCGSGKKYKKCHGRK